MRCFAEQRGYDSEFWGIVGLLHDIDFEQWPEQHCVKAPELLRVLFELSMYPRLKGKPGSLALARTVMHFVQYVYQGLWVEDSQLKQLPHVTDRVSAWRAG